MTTLTTLVSIDWQIGYESEGHAEVEAKLADGTTAEASFTVSEDGIFTLRDAPESPAIDWAAVGAAVAVKCAERVKESFLDASYDACEAHDEAVADGRIRSFRGRRF